MGPENFVRPSPRDIVIATRRSSLAQCQSDNVGRALNDLNPKVSRRLVPLESEGDRVQDHPLADIGGKGLFTRNIEQAVLSKEADLAVHSFKDLPCDEATTGLIIAAVPKRAPVHDVLISATADRVEDLPEGATIGTCSKRRAAQLLRIRPDLRIVPFRGNIDTRLRKVLEEKVVDATLLAAAGLERLGLTEHTTKPLPIEQVLPSAGQGALAVQCRLDDHVTLRRCMPINHAATAAQVNAERQIVAALGADCHSPMAALAETDADGSLRIRVRVLSADGKTCLEDDRRAAANEATDACQQIAEDLIRQGAADLIEQATRAAEASS